MKGLEGSNMCFASAGAIQQRGDNSQFDIETGNVSGSGQTKKKK